MARYYIDEKLFDPRPNVGHDPYNYYGRYVPNSAILGFNAELNTDVLWLNKDRKYNLKHQWHFSWFAVVFGRRVAD